MKNKSYFILLLALAAAPAVAQGTLDSEEVDVIRDYNPILADAVKVGITGLIPDNDTETAPLTYNVPLTFYTMPYQPIRIKPVALTKSPKEELTKNYLRAGFGTQFTPLGELYLNSAQSDKFQYGLAARYTSAKSNRENQQYSDLDIDGRGKFFFDKAFVMPINAWFRNDVVHYYGYDEPLTFENDSVRQRFSNYGLSFAFANLKKNDAEIDYSLGAGFRGISSLDGYRQMNPYIDLIADKRLKNDHKVGAGLNIDYYNFNGPLPFETVFTTLSLRYGIVQPGWSLQASIDNTIGFDSKYFPIPRVDFSKDLIGDKLVFIAGVDGQLLRNNFASLTGLNPFLADSFVIKPTSDYQFYGGIRASTADNLSFSAKGYYSNFIDQVFFINNPTDTLRFKTVYGSGSRAGVNVELGYFIADVVEVAAVLNAFTFNELSGVEEAWHTPTLEWQLSTAYQLNSKLKLGAQVFGLGKSLALMPDSDIREIKGTVDINLNATYAFRERFDIFLDINNIAGIQYERYYNYPSYGFNLLGGISFSF